MDGLTPEGYREIMKQGRIKALVQLAEGMTVLDLRAAAIALGLTPRDCTHAVYMDTGPQHLVYYQRNGIVTSAERFEP